ncbi:inositol polyphosphate multikinase isoform X1 [Silurus meridionalis]|uniref:inositol polyphosphate multikinase isoform X1 n=1 Tax=Silurus meridionalis TaxID=175797 RepID=UPI001EEB2C7C|nr:inositol polyphosphate multikinase isoform X1 [Silurus meridionalis]
MAAENQVLKSCVGAGDEVRHEHEAGWKSRRAERARDPVPLSHQVAGHKYGIHKVGILQNFDGTVLKQLQPPPRGPCEMHFYKQVFAQDCKDPHLLALQQHLPKYHGTWSTPDKPNELYLKLEDVAGKFVRPCIMDVKIGRKSYDPFASQEKREEQIRKYPLMEEIGFLILGMRVYHIASGAYISHEQFYGRSLTKETLKTGLATFFHNGEELRKDVISIIINKIHDILHWFEGQKQLHFYASSLLFVYEGSLHTANTKNKIEALKGQRYRQAESENNNAQLTNSKLKSSCKQANCISIHNAIHHVKKVNGFGSHSLHHQGKGITTDMFEEKNTVSESSKGGKEENVEVRMIDFAHVFPSDSSDDGYIYGLRSLLFFLEQILQD